MKTLFGPETFTGFGSTRYRPSELPTESARHQGRAKTLHEAVRTQAPKSPGVYGMLDRDGVLIYVGKAKSLRCRLMSYFRPNSRNPKAGRIIEETRSLLWEQADSEFAALLRELELIRRFLPRFNSQGKPGRARYVYICLGREPAPYAYVSRKPNGKEAACFGPIASSAHAKEAVRRLNDQFGLRDCAQSQPMRFADQRDLFDEEHTPGCLRYEIGTCCGPCVGGCSRRQYRNRLGKAVAFLNGEDEATLPNIEREMNRASASLQFEKAGSLRDKLVALQWAHDRLTWLRNARERHSFVYRQVGRAGRPLWYLIHRGQVGRVIVEPRTKRQKAEADRLIAQVFRDRDETGLTPVAEVDSVLLVAAWFRKNPEEKSKVKSVKGVKDPGASATD